MNDAVKQILCIKWGTRYGPKYVNRIYAMVERNITPPFRVICLTDDKEGIREEVICRDLPSLGCDVPKKAVGKWPKTALWGDKLFDIEGVALFLDLDIVITSNIDSFFEFGEPEDVILARNWVKPLEKLGQSSIFRFKIGSHSYMLDNFQKDPEGIAGKYRYEQAYVTNCVKGGIKFWPHGWVRHFRMDCLGPWPLRFIRTPRLPRKSKVVIFPGKPDPEDAILGRWGENNHSKTRLEHIKRVFNEKHKKPFRFFKQFVLPTKWVEEHWKE